MGVPPYGLMQVALQTHGVGCGRGVEELITGGSLMIQGINANVTYLA